MPASLPFSRSELLSLSGNLRLFVNLVGARYDGGMVGDWVARCVCVRSWNVSGDVDIVVVLVVVRISLGDACNEVRRES